MSDKERVSEMESPIEILCADMLLHVFSYLDVKSLKNSALVCKHWNNVISESKYFTLALNNEILWTYRFHKIMSLTRRFQSITLRLSEYEPNKKWTENVINSLVQVAVRHGPIRKLVLSKAEIKNSSDFYRILSSMPLLNEVVLNEVKVDKVDDFTGGNEAFLSKLNKLTISDSDWNIFKFFISTPIRELQIFNDLYFKDIPHPKNYMRFLQAFQQLESIELDKTSYTIMFRTTLDDAICLKLKRLKYSPFFRSYDNNVARNFGTFLETQASSLTELDLNYVHPTIIKIIFTKLKVLEKLRINPMMLPIQSSFYASFKKMPKLKELILFDNIQSELAVKQILANCANLETFSASWDTYGFLDNIVNFMAANNPAVKSLSLVSLPKIISPELKFSHLKFLHVEMCDNFEHLLQFLDNNPTVETVSLNLEIDNVILDDATLELWLSHPYYRNVVAKSGIVAIN
ncbi:hypothetical protein Bhyg_03763 [Pseudolycoriella hygida]|uniref:F-box domain-containing protein n=1 Tax=Pseudolycoriella hygida TaxID=35572 RepID=A0A9Q0S915_9DIPT|nr:hypothetical protein Bhyg_03763 [Pseudolycoriella hygida]